MQTIRLEGQRFGRLVVLSEAPQRRWGQVQWVCQCDCGIECTIPSSLLRDGRSRSCGCLMRDTAAAINRTHGLSKKVPEYGVWLKMRDRCTSPTHPAFKNYGGRGITICPEWESFERFYADMGSRPSPVHTIDRIDNDGPYAPWNCRWATRSEQNRNKRNVQAITHNGEALLPREWAARLGISRQTLNYRLKHWTVERAVTEPRHWD